MGHYVLGHLRHLVGRLGTKTDRLWLVLQGGHVIHHKHVEGRTGVRFPLICFNVYSEALGGRGKGLGEGTVSCEQI